MTRTIVRKLAKSGKTIGKSFDLTWRYGLNLAPTLSYSREREPLQGEAARVLEELNRNGVAVTTAEALLGSDSCYNDLVAAVDQLEQDMADELAAARAALDAPDGSTQKPFLLSLLGKSPKLDPNSIWGRFALQKPIVGIANDYFGMYTTMRFYNIWHTFTTQKEASQSQYWHRDPEDRFILKVFVYLSDVDDGAGPFTYAKGSHGKGQFRQEPAYLHKDGETGRSDDSQMAAVVPPEQWLKGVGAKGTIIFADTRGYHKGGLARERDRLLYTCEFLSPGGASGEGLSTAPR